MELCCLKPAHLIPYLLEGRVHISHGQYYETDPSSSTYGWDDWEVPASDNNCKSPRATTSDTCKVRIRWGEGGESVWEFPRCISDWLNGKTNIKIRQYPVWTCQLDSNSCQSLWSVPDHGEHRNFCLTAADTC